jgi:hypothetical protein
MSQRQERRPVMGSLVTKIPISEVMATLEILDKLGITRGDLKYLRNNDEFCEHVADFIRSKGNYGIKINKEKYIFLFSASQAICRTLVQHFKEDGYQASAAQNIQEVVLGVLKNLPSLIIFQVKEEKNWQSDVETLITLKDWGKRKWGHKFDKIPLVIIFSQDSSNSTHESNIAIFDKLWDLGAVDIIKTPIDLDDLMNKIAFLINK